MKALREILVCALLAATVALVLVTTSVINTIPTKIDTATADADRELHFAMTEVDETRANVMAQVSHAQGLIDGHLTGLRHQVQSVIDKADARVGDALGRVDVALVAVDGARKDVDAMTAAAGPTLANVAAITSHANSIAQHVDDALPQFTDCAYLDDNGVPVGGNPDCVFNRFQGASKAIEKAAVDVSVMTKDARLAIPPILDDVKQVSEHAVKASDEAARLSKNLADDTKPLPKYIRYPLQLAGLLAPLASGAIESIVALGYFH